MTFGLPPKIKITQRFDGVSNQELVPALEKIFESESYRVYDVGPYNLKAEKNLGFSFISFFAMTRVCLNAFCMISEDGQVTIEMTYDYKSARASTFYDRGKTQKAVDVIFEKLKAEFVLK